MNLDQYIKLLHPWTFTVDTTVEKKKKKYATRRPTVATVIAISHGEAGMDTPEKIRDFVRGLFVDCPDEFDDWSLELLAVIGREYLQAATEYLRKNQQALLPTMTAAGKPSAA